MENLTVERRCDYRICSFSNVARLHHQVSLATSAVIGYDAALRGLDSRIAGLANEISNGYRPSIENLTQLKDFAVAKQVMLAAREQASEESEHIWNACKAKNAQLKADVIESVKDSAILAVLADDSTTISADIDECFDDEEMIITIIAADEAQAMILRDSSLTAAVLSAFGGNAAIYVYGPDVADVAEAA